MRLFVALSLPDEATAFLTGLQQELQREVRSNRWQPSHQMHLTIHFLGEVQESLVSALRDDLDEVSGMVQPFRLQIGHLGVFARRQQPIVLWTGITGEVSQLSRLHLLLGERFARHGEITPEQRRYRPHITLARGPFAPAGPLPLEQWNDRFYPPTLPSWVVPSIHLYRSQLQPGGAVHTLLHTVRLGRNHLPPRNS